MKIISVIMLVCAVHVSAKSVSQKITFSGKNVPLKMVFAEIEKQSGYIVAYTQDLISVENTVTIDARNKPLEEFLEETLTPQGIDYVVEKRTIFLKNKMVEKQQLPPVVIKGRIINEKKEGVVATVMVKGTNIGTTSDAEGYFTLETNGEVKMLVVSGVSIETREIKITRVSLLLINIISRIDEEKEVVVNTGYWTSSKKKNLGNIEKITSKEISNQPVNNVLQAAVGRMAGVEIVQTSGVPGYFNSIRIRGLNSLQRSDDANRPLYIVDGVPFLSAPIQSQGINLLHGSDPLATINPESVESIEVLKDADATSIYGSRGANGVVLITTKKGSRNINGKTSVEANFYKGFARSNRLNGLMNSHQYLQMRREAFANDNVVPTLQNAPDLLLWDTTRFTDWQKELFGGTSHFNDASIAISGGNAYTVFRFGVGFHSETTVFPGDYGYTRGTGNLAVNHRSANNKFTFDFNTNYGFDNNDLFGGYNQFIKSGINLAPVAPALYNADGKLNWQPYIDGRPSWNNPMAYTLISHNAKNYSFIANSVVSFAVLPKLHLKLRTGIARTANKEVISTPLTSFNPSIINAQNSTVITNGDVNIWNIEPQLDFSKNIDGGKLDIMIGGSFQSRDASSLSFTGFDYASDQLLGDLSSAGTIYKGQSTLSQYKYAAVYGRVGYNFKEKYLINLTGRRDGSSRFGPGKQFGNFGAVGAGWIFSKEKLIADNFHFLSFGKLRSSYGVTGSDNIGDYRYLDTYAATGYSYQGISGLNPSGLFNPDFAWEVNQKLEAGIELGFLKDKYSLTVSWYHNRSSNQLVGYVLPRMTGFTSVNDNLDATVQNTGWEFVAQTTNIQQNNFSWRSTLNFSIPRSKLISFPGLASSSYNSSYVVGYPVTISKVYKGLGVNPQTGNYEVADLNGDGFFNAGDQQGIVDRGRRWYGGFGNTITYKNFEINILAEFAMQTYNPLMVFGNTAGSFDPGLSYGNQLSAVFGSRWTKAGTAANAPRFSQEVSAIDTYANRRVASDISFLDASFIRIKNVSLNWQLPQKLLIKSKLQSLRLFIQAQNLYTFTNYIGLDPATNSVGVLPPLRTMTAGFNLKF